jgi:anti-sigma B factor antagonist
MTEGRRTDLRLEPGATIRVSGELDLSTTEPFRAALERATASPDTIVCLDLSGVTFLDSSAIHAIAVAVNRVPDGCVILHEPSPAARRLFTIVGLDRWPNVHIV